jgi:hypothetical protein
LIDYHQALREMHAGKVVKYVGSADLRSDVGGSFCMCRGAIFLFKDGMIQWDRIGNMVYDPAYMYELTGETVDTRSWVQVKNHEQPA